MLFLLLPLLLIASSQPVDVVPLLLTERINRMLTETNGHKPERILLRRPVSCSASSSPPTTATAIQFLLSRNAVPRVRTQGPYLARVRTSLLN